MKHLRTVLYILGGLGTIYGAGWAGNVFVSQFARSSALAATQVQVQSLYDVRIEQLTIQRDRLLQKRKLSDKDKRDLQYLERELELARKMRQVK